MNEPKERVAEAIARAHGELEQALAELERLPPIDADKVAFAAHALSNYVTITGGTVELLQDLLAGHPDERVHRWLDGLHQATSMMTHTVSQLMNSSASPAMVLRPERVDLVALVGRVCDFYRRMGAPKDIRVVYLLEPPVPEVWGDRVALAAVMDNLLSNAVKYTPHGKNVVVRVGSDGTSAVCSVRDEGPGLRDGEKEQLFQRGVRLSAKPTGGESVNGYGLAVAKELIDRLGGEIWYEDAPETGAMFSIRLPAYEPGEHPAT